jgi:hypothetical protein
MISKCYSGEAPDVREALSLFVFPIHVPAPGEGLLDHQGMTLTETRTRHQLPYEEILHNDHDYRPDLRPAV